MQLDEIARRHGFTIDATTHALRAIERGNGAMAQFDHPELGGAGQWMRGGMTMLADMGNDALRRRVDALFADLSELAARDQKPAERPSSSQRKSAWWPPGLGAPATSGGQNDVRYAYFPDRRRLAVDRGGTVTVYDTLEHRIGGVAQQQGTTSTLAFASDRGIVDVDTLPRANPDDVD